MKGFKILALFAFMSLACVSAFGQEKTVLEDTVFVKTNKLTVDYNAIETQINQNPAQYEALWKRYEAGDVNLTLSDLAVVYYGFALMPHTTPAEPDADTVKAAEEAFNAGQHDKAYDTFKRCLAANPVSLKWLFRCYLCARALNAPEPEKRTVGANLVGLLELIAATGDGRSTESAYKVIDVSDEYMFLQLHHEIDDVKGQSLATNDDGGTFDRIVTTKNGVDTDYYFDASLIFLKWNRMLGF